MSLTEKGVTRFGHAALAKDVLLVPLAALKEEKGGHHGTLRDGKRVKVKVGLTSPTHAEVLDGLSAGEELRLE